MTLQLKEASYKGVSFLYINAPTTGGNRIIKFNYPGSDRQSIEVQGKQPRSFSMTIVIPFDNYYAERDNLLRVLEDGEPGILVHPTFGELKNMVSGQYTIREPLSNLGRAEITVTFDRDDGPGVPIQTVVTGAVVNQLAEEAIAQMKQDFTDNFSVDLKYPQNFQDAKTTLEDITTALNDLANIGTPIAEEAADYRRKINSLSGAIGSLIQAPSDLAEVLFNTVDSIVDLYETPAETLGGLQTLFAFDANLGEFESTTVGLAERRQNRGALELTTAANTFCLALVQATLIDYTSTDELESVQADLEAQYLALRNKEFLTNAALERIDRERVAAYAVFDQIRVNARQVVTVNVSRAPLSVICYNFYGNTDLVDVLAELNDIKQNAFVEGDLRILSQ